MRLQIGKIWLIAIIGIQRHRKSRHNWCHQPLEWMALAEGNELINSEIEKQNQRTDQDRRCCRIQWLPSLTRYTNGREVHSYLKSVNGYASSLKACTHLYDDGVKIFITLAKLKAAIKNNPQGIVASMSMNNLYIETATELVSVFNLLNDAVEWGNGEYADRSRPFKTLWALNDKLSASRRSSTNCIWASATIHHEWCVEQCHGRDDRQK